MVIIILGICKYCRSWNGVLLYGDCELKDPEPVGNNWTLWSDSCSKFKAKNKKED